MRRGSWFGLVAGLVLGSVVTMAFTAGAAAGDPMVLGEKNTATTVTRLNTRGGLRIDNFKAGNPALILQVADPATAPLQVNSPALVANLNADRVDGKEAAAFSTRGDPLHTAGCSGCTGITINAFGAYLPGFDLSDSSSSDPVFAAADLTGANMSGAGMPGAQFGRALLAGADFTGSWVSNGNFFSADLTGAKFNGATIDGVSFHSADLDGADFTDADLTGGNLTSASMVGTIWDNTTCPDGTNTDTNGDFDCDGDHRTGP